MFYNFIDEGNKVGFKPGQSGNLLGRPRHIDPRSQDLHEFCRQHKGNIKKIGEIVIECALNRDPWALKLGMEYFYPKPGTFVAISKEETKDINVTLEHTMGALTHEEKQDFLKLWMKSKKGVRAFPTIDESGTSCKNTLSSINNAEDDELIVVHTDGGKRD